MTIQGLLEKHTIKERTRKQKADIFMGIVFQIYLFIPWINITGKYNTIHMYLIKAFQENDYVNIYIETFLKNHTWPQQYSRMSALIFLLSMIVMLLVQCLELFKLYQNIKSINNSNYLLAIGIAWFAVFYIFLSALDAHSEGFVKLYSMPAYFYMITFLVLIVVWILLDMQADIWDDETAKHKAELPTRWPWARDSATIRFRASSSPTSGDRSWRRSPCCATSCVKSSPCWPHRSWRAGADLWPPCRSAARRPSTPRCPSSRRPPGGPMPWFRSSTAVRSISASRFW